MFCPKCGKSMQDGAAFCGSCGHRIEPIQAQTPPVQTPPVNPAYRPPVPPAPAVSEFDKKAGKLVYLTFFLTLVLLFVSVLLPLSTNFMEIPMVNLVLSMVGAEDSAVEVREELNDATGILKSLINRYEDEMNSIELDAVNRFLEAAEKMRDELSILSIRNFINVTKDIAVELSDYDEIVDGLDGFSEVEAIINVAIIGVVGSYFLPFLFTLLGGLLKNMGLTITALVFMVLTQAVLCGVIWIVLTMIVYITQAVFCNKAAHAKRALGV